MGLTATKTMSMIVIKVLRFILFLVVLLFVFWLIDYLFILFTTWALDKVFYILSWQWWKIILLGLLCIGLLRLLWGYLRAFMAMLISVTSLISPFVRLNLYCIISLAIINAVPMIYFIWAQQDGFSLTAILLEALSTYLVLQLTYAIYIGSIASMRAINQ